MARLHPTSRATWSDTVGREESLTRHRIKFAIGCLVLVVGLSVIHHLRSQFTPERWADGDLGTRLRVSKDLSKNYISAGMSQSEVIYLLGEPDAEYDIGTLDAMGGTNSHRAIDYDLGPAIRWDAAYLKIYFDANNRVISSEIYGA